MNFIKILFFALAISALNICSVNHADAATVDWTKGVVQAELPAYNKETSVADFTQMHQDLKRTIEDIMITEARTFKTYLSENDRIEMRFKYLLDNPQIITGPDGKKYCQISLFGISRSVAGLIISDNIDEKPFLSSVPLQTNETSENEEKVQQEKKSNNNKENITGLIIDCRSLYFPPLMFPTVTDENGTVIYSKDYFERALLLSRGLVAYSSADRNTDRVGNNPLTVIPTGIEQGRIVVDTESANKILRANKSFGFLRAAKVLILI